MSSERTEETSGSLVAIYAAQAFEEAPELPFPEGAAITRENYYGMLSWTLAQTLKNRHNPLTYRELLRLVSAKYRSSRGTRSPVPFAEGDLNREVLGIRVWPHRPTIYVNREKQGGQLKVDAGRLQGLTPNSILSVLPPLDAKTDPKTILGHLKVTSVTPSSANVVPVKREEGKDPSQWEILEDGSHIPELARCEVIVRDFGDQRIKLFTKSEDVATSLTMMAAEVKEMFRIVAKEEEADWVLRVVSAQDAKKEYGIERLAGETVFLVQGVGKGQKPQGEQVQLPAIESRFPKVFGQYPLDKQRQLIEGFERDLPKIFRWESLWHVAAEIDAAGEGETHGLRIEVLRLKDENDSTGEEIRGTLKDGDEVAFWSQNGGQEPLWVTAFYLDHNLQIRIVFRGGVARGKRVELGQGTMRTNGNSGGLEGLIVFAIPQSIQRNEPQFDMLEQEPLQVVEAVKRGPKNLPDTPFGKLLAQAAFQRGTRSWEPRISNAPAILSQSWVLIPK